MADPTEAPEVLARAIRDTIIAGNTDDRFTVGGRPLNTNRIYSARPADTLAPPFPVVLVEWTEYYEVLRHVAYPTQIVRFRVLAKVRVILSELEAAKRLEDARILTYRLENWLGCCTTLGGKVQSFRVERATGDLETLAQRGIMAHGLLEVRGEVDETRVLRD
jgi:hypothetical protein